MYRWLLTALVVLLFTTGSYAEDERLRKCVDSAMNAHDRQLTAIEDWDEAFVSPEQQMLKRRIDEQYCLTQTACFMYGVEPEERKMLTSALFSSCLDDQIVKD